MLPCQRNCLAIARGIALLVTLGLGFVLGPAACRADTPPTHYLAFKEFEIPYAINADQSLKQLHLFASTDRKTYARVASTALRNGKFTYNATSDGEYSFVVQIEDGNGGLMPQNPELAVPTLRVIVDTQNPQVALRAVQPKEGRAAVEWQIVDANIDLRTLRLEAKGPGEMAWTPLKITLLKAAQFGWNPAGGGPIEVRLFVKDFAGNQATATCQVNPSAAPASALGPNDDRQVIFVKHKRFRLTYKIDGAGPSSVKEVQIWMTRDRSQWSRFGSAPPTGPHEITVTATGRYGFTLRPISGVGRGPAAPRGGDLPQIWVEVDETPPEVKLNPVHVGEGADSGKVVVKWTATDKFLKDQPITIFYSKSATGPWEMLQENVENTGTANVTPPEGVFEFFVKVEAVDKAGNKGSAQMRESIKVDLNVPTVPEIGVQAIEVTVPPTQP
jgi:hypothetical protein